MIFFPQFVDRDLQALAEQCGLTIDTNNVLVSSKEIEFFCEELVKLVKNGKFAGYADLP